MKNIGFLQFGALGDCLLATVIAKEVRDRHPNDRITWVLLDCFREVAQGCPWVDDYVAWPLHRGITRQSQEMAAWKTIKAWSIDAFDLVYKPQCYPDHDWTLKPNVHLLDQMAEYAGVTIDPDNRRIGYVGRSRHMFWPPFERPTVTINCRSNTQRPALDEDQWSDVARILGDHGVGLEWGDREPSPRMTLSGWLATIFRSHLHVGYNSGGAWLAASTDTPQIVIHGKDKCTPDWLDSVKQANIKEDVTEMVAPSVDELVAAILERVL